MPTFANPLTVWQRLTTDATRLSAWAQRSGTPEQQEAARQAIDVLNTLATHLNLSPIPNAVSSPQQFNEAQQQGRMKVYAQGKLAREQGLDANMCPHEGPIMRKAWRDGYDGKPLS